MCPLVRHVGVWTIERARLRRADEGACLSVFIVTVKYSGEPARDAAKCDTRELAAHAAAELLASSKRPDGELPVAVGIVVEREPIGSIA
jgi:hypothetical protein